MSALESDSDLLGTVELRIPSKPEWVAVARLAVAAIGNRLPFSAEEIEDLKLAMAEACTLCITQGTGAQTIDITCEAAASALRVEVRDDRYRARGDLTFAQRSSNSDETEGEGLGVFLIQALMDDLQVSVDPNMGTALVMTKRVGA